MNITNNKPVKKTYGNIKCVMLNHLKWPYWKRYKFWELPIMVKLLPMLAAIVMRTMVKMSLLSSSFLRILIASGTNMIKATSFVTNILMKKLKPTKTKTKFFKLLTFFKIVFVSHWKKPAWRKPATITINNNKLRSVFRSTEAIVFLIFGCTKKLKTAKSAEINNKVSCFTNVIIDFIISPNSSILIVYH